MDLNAFQWLTNFGFAAIVAMYVLMRLEPAIKELTKTVSLLSVIVAKMGGMDYTRIKEEFRNGKNI